MKIKNFLKSTVKSIKLMKRLNEVRMEIQEHFIRNVIEAPDEPTRIEALFELKDEYLRIITRYK